MRKTSKNKWFFIGVGFFAIFIIISAIIITSKVSEYNDNKDVVTTSYLFIEHAQLEYVYDIFI